MVTTSDMRVLIADHDAATIELLQCLLTDAGYTNLHGAQDSDAIAQLCGEWCPDVILLDPTITRMSDHGTLDEICEATDARERPWVLVLSADTACEARYRALAMGAKDFITKPIDPTELLLRMRSLLRMRCSQLDLRHRAARLDTAVRERTLELEHARLESLTLLAALGEYHDEDTHQHTQRVGLLAARLAQRLGCSASFVSNIRHAAPLHDIGKIGISRRVLLKPGPLTPAERENMMRHVEVGARILGSATSPGLVLAAEIARTHHERWDGAGYPVGLAGEDIPLSGRITAVADVFDALTHTRPYKPAWPVDRARAEITEQAGRQFDPRVVDAFASIGPRELENEPLGAAAGMSEDPERNLGSCTTRPGSPMAAASACGMRHASTSNA